MNKVTQTQGIFGKDTGGPLILLFSMRERVRDILTIGLVQCNYQVLHADTPFIASIKASQFLPELIIMDITPDNTKDIILIKRLQSSIRTRKIAVLLVVPFSLRQIFESLKTEAPDLPAISKSEAIHVLEYPFNFADMLKKVKGLVSQIQEQKKNISDAGPQSNERIAKNLFDLQIPVETKLLEVESCIHKQWAFPFTVIRALDIIDSEESCCNQLAQCIGADVGASAAILKVANTVYYAKRGKSITDIKEAVFRVGFKETRNLMACLALIDLSAKQHEGYGFSRQEFWLHSLATALIAEKLCIDCGYRRPELAFIAALVHDLGKIPLDNNFEEVFAHLLEATANSITAFNETETNLIGFSHTELGHYLTSKWNFPSVISSAILNHHAPDRILAVKTPMERIVQEAVYCANIFAKALNLGHSCDEILRDIPEQMSTDLKIHPQGLGDRFITTILRSLQTMCKILNISSKNLVVLRERPEDKNSEVVVVLNNKPVFHPVITALKNNGFAVRVTNQFTPEANRQATIVISISEKGPPIDIMLYDDDALQAPESAAALKIFLLDSIPIKKQEQGFLDGNTLFLDRHHLDMRYLLHVIDRFLEKVVCPDSSAVVRIDDEELKEEKSAN